DAEQEKLNKIDAELNDEQREVLKQRAVELKQRQETEDDLSLLPKVGLEDIPEELHIVRGVTKDIQHNGKPIPLHTYHAGTNGLYYNQIIIEIPKEILSSPYLSLLNVLMGEVGAGEYNYLELQQQQTAVSGGV
ncbi:peptidase M16, partial [Pseudomonas syringae]